MIAALLGLIAQVLHIALMLAAAPLLAGLMRWARARRLGHAGPALLQPWRDLMRLARKQPVVGEGTSVLFTAAPLVDFAASLTAAALVPSFARGMATAPAADVLVVFGLLALARVTLALAAMDAGTAPGGLAAGRAMTLAALAEPVLLLTVFALALAAGTTNIDLIATRVVRGTSGPHAGIGLALVALLMVMPDSTEPAALRHDHSGRHLALAEGAAWLRALAMLSLTAAAFVPYGMAEAAGLPLLWPLGLLAWGVKVVVLALGFAALDSLRAAPALARIAGFSTVALALALLAAILLCVAQGVA